MLTTLPMRVSSGELNPSALEILSRHNLTFSNQVAAFRRTMLPRLSFKSSLLFERF
jgi:hypothetical protein